MTKKHIGIFLMVVWVFQSTSPFLVFTMARWALRVKNFSITQKEVKHIKGQTIHFKSEANINWEERGKEFMKDGVLYDVLSITEGKDGVDVICFADKKEKHLISLIKKENEKKQEKNNFLKQVYKNKILVRDKEEDKPKEGQKLTFSFRYELDSSEPTIQISIPPPKA